MNIAIILASGIGKRMKQKKPKQFLKINNKTILEYSVEKFAHLKEVDKIIIVCSKEWIDFVKKIFKNNKKIYYCVGGSSRNRSIINSLKYCENNFEMNNNDIVITHDANRIFVSDEIITKNIQQCIKYNCVLTGLPFYDTTFKHKKNKISGLLNRDEIFCSQTPQTFKYKKLLNIIENNLNYKYFDNVDLGTLGFLNNENILIIQGSKLNFKITVDDDFQLAKQILK